MALSTEWVALKTGQSGSGGVEYSLKFICKLQIRTDIQSQFIQISIVHFLTELRIIFWLIVQIVFIGFKKLVPCLEKIVAWTSVHTLIHGIDADSCKSFSKMLDYMEWVYRNFTVGKILFACKFVRFLHVNSDISDAFSFTFRYRFKMS